MPLESLDPKSRPDIQRMSVEAPEGRDIKFDPERDITPDILDFLRRRYETFNQGSLEIHGFPTLVDIKFLFPEQYKRINMSGIKNRLIEMVDKHENQENMHSWLNFMYQLKMLFPEDFSKREVSDSMWLKMKEMVREKNTEGYINGWKKIKICWPERMDAFNKNSALSFALPLLEQFRKEGRWYDFSRLAVDMRIVCPESFASSNIDTKDWQNIMKKWSEFAKKFKSSPGRTQAWLYGNMAVDLKILAADKVEVNENGLQITYDKKPESVEKTPIRKEF